MWLLNKSTINVWRFLALALKGCVFVFLGFWVLLLSTICSSPRFPVAATGNTVSYNCHGSIVFITSLQHALLMWLIPALVVAGVCGIAATKRAKRPLKDDNSESG